MPELIMPKPRTASVGKNVYYFLRLLLLPFFLPSSRLCVKSCSEIKISSIHHHLNGLETGDRVSDSY